MERMRDGRPFLDRVFRLLKPRPISLDEFRFFKRHRMTREEAAAQHAELIAARARHAAWVERNNERLLDIADERAAKAVA